MPPIAKYVLLLAGLAPLSVRAQEPAAERSSEIAEHFSLRRVPASGEGARRAAGTEGAARTPPDNAVREQSNFNSRQATYEEPATPIEKPAQKLLSVAARNSEKKLPLAKPGEVQGEKRIGGSTSSLLGSLGIVVGLFLLAAWMLRRAMPRASQSLPTGVVEVLGRAPLTGRQHAHLIRCGNKLLLVSITPAGMETLTEITDPVEVDRIAGICQQGRGNSTTAAFRKVFSDLAAEPAAGGFVGTYDKASRIAGASATRNRSTAEGYHV